MSETPSTPDPANPPAPQAAPAPPASAAEAIAPITAPAVEKPSAETLNAAYKAFKKRVKVTSLDHNSRLGKSPMTSGSSELTAITPPAEYPRAVWQALVDEGKLKYAGQGMYGLR